ncbi:unnamed protein product [Didymodactylos carnosus]|uniref:Alpha N-terminal protein methyltransferase 1 n=1 Tax=Didymodactylos carnosus TaxID=1234261 RepID=A0A813W5B6_9BILA|nr:unnamed protein product [Didymodactylos carnosus]CAF0848312.1 unnamed protein product [Didymodactylos carnosus]CAF3539451.1 unnamed protein product [Didymodactylos carnosus]CAF3635967.1 unnamed protein product [Didymodactylos carnosus]
MEGELSNVDERVVVTKQYYTSRAPTIDTMLGGYSVVHESDIQESEQLLKTLFRVRKTCQEITHCFHSGVQLGCGIGRVTKHLLVKYFNRIDINDLLPEYIEQTKLNLGEDLVDKVDKTYCCSIADLIVDKSRYDVIWTQWVLGYLDADSAVQLLKRLKLSLKKHGLIILKDNCSDQPEFDPDDQYYVRSPLQFYDVAHRSGLTVVKDQRSRLKQVVRELLPIRIFVLANSR